jgi:hypothetical protein
VVTGSPVHSVSIVLNRVSIVLNRVRVRGLSLG